MDRLVVNGNKIIEYTEILKKYIKDFLVIIRKLVDRKKQLIWDSDNYDKCMALYDNMLKQNLEYTNRMIKLIEYLNHSINRHEESLEIIKKEYTNLSSEYKDMIIYEKN